MDGWLNDVSFIILGGFRKGRRNMQNVLHVLECFIIGSVFGDVLDNDEAEVIEIRLDRFCGLDLCDGIFSSDCCANFVASS